MRPADVSFPGPRLVSQSTGTKDGPFECVSFDEVLIGLQFPLHVHWDGATNSLRHCFVFIVLVTNSKSTARTEEDRNTTDIMRGEVFLIYPDIDG